MAQEQGHAPAAQEPTHRSLLVRLPWKPIGIGVLAFLLGVGVGLTGEGDNEELEKRLASLEDQLESALERADASETELREGQVELDTLRTELREREAALGEREEELQAEERSRERSSIGDGIWQSGTDFSPGLYRAPGGASCYWALLRSADTNDIINNGGFGPNQTLQIDSPWFQTSDCGDWKKIG